jgi:Tfp pilus assembly protein PilF
MAPPNGNPDPKPEGKWKQAEDLFHRALERPEAQRGAWLAAQMAEPAVVEEVKSLLASLTRQDRMLFLDQDPHLAEPATVLPAERFGAYRTVRLLGRGGMCAVYLAERADGRFERNVAVKIIPAYLASEDFLRRFESEGQLLAALDHPNIAGLLDGGISGSGHPYLILEHVEGERLDRYCDNRKLSVAERLRLFQQVCEAVDYAHRHQILHRDLKPANILATAEGVVKLLDFGTAVLVGEDKDITVTRARMLTPRYASPEQLRGGRTGVTSDVFSLGVILFELLTGAWPFGNPESLLSELRRAAGEASPSTMSSVINPENAEIRAGSTGALRRALEGDLSAIVLKALENDPEQRYGTVRQLIEDLDRYVKGQPVQAAPGRRFRFAARLGGRRALWAATTLVLLAAAGWFWYRAPQHILRSRDQRASNLFQLGQYYWNRHTLDSLQKAEQFFRQATEVDPKYARAYAYLADTHAMLPEYGVQEKHGMEAGRLAAQRALELDSSLFMAHSALAWISFGYDWNWNAAEPEFRRAIALGPYEAHPHQRYGLALITRGRFQEAEAELDRAQRLDPVSVMPMINLAELWYYERRFDREEEQLQRVLDRDPHYVIARAMLVKLKIVSGRSKEAVAEARSLNSGPEGATWCQELAEAYASDGQRAAALRLALGCGEPDPIPFPGTYMYLGDYRHAMEIMEQRYAAHNPYLQYLNVDPNYDLLRSEPRFREMLKKLGF